jgi:hypothetical protein
MTSKSADRSTLAWRKSSYSSGNGQCVEIAFHDGRVAVRDSKHPESELWLGEIEFGAMARLR